MTESALVQRCRVGDREAQRELYLRTSERIYRLLLRMTGNEDDAFDMAQETYIQAFQRIDQFQGKSSVATWLYRIAVTQALQFRRHQVNVRAKMKEIPVQECVSAEGDRLASRLDLDEALGRIDASDRAILLLRYQEDLSYRGIAEVLGCPAGTVGSRLNRARQRVRDILRKSYALGEERDCDEHPIQELRMSNGE